MKQGIEFLFKRYKVVLTLFFLLFGYGIYSYYVIPKQEMPEIDAPYMVITITAPGMNATAISDEIEKIEENILTYSDVLDVRSTSYDNYAVIISSFSFSVDDPALLSEEIFQSILEFDLHPNFKSIEYRSTFDDPHIIYSMHSSLMSEETLLLEAKNFRDELLLIDEVKEVKIDSGYQTEVMITLNTTLLESYQLTMYDVYQILYSYSIDIPLGGIIEEDGFISVSTEVGFHDLDTLKGLIIIPLETPVLLEDIADVSIVNTSLKEYFFDGEQTVLLSVYFQDEIDFTKMDSVMQETVSKYEAIHKVDIDEMLYLPDYVESQVNSVFYSLLIAIVIVMIIVLIGIGFRNSILIILTTPIIIFGTIGFLYLFGYQLHKLTIVGLIVSIGILVDNQIVITEGIKRNLDHDLSKYDASKKAILDNLLPVLSSTLTTVAAFIVVAFLPGFLGEIVSSMPITVIITLIISFVVSMTLSPILATLFLKPTQKEKKQIHKKRIKSMISFTIEYPFIWILISVLLLGGSSYLIFTNQQIDLYPNDERNVLYIDFEHDELLNIEQTYQLSSDIESVLEEQEKLQHIVSSIGGDLPTFHFSSKFINETPNTGRIYAIFDMNENELLQYKDELELLLQDIDGEITVNSLELSPPLAPVKVLITSDNIENLESLKSSFYRDIESLDTIKTYQETTNQKSKKYEIEYDFLTMSNTFISKALIDSHISMYLNGLDLEAYYYNNSVMNIQINSDLLNIYQLYDTSLYSDQLQTEVLLSDVITIHEVIDYSVIEKHNNRHVNIIEIYPSNDSDNLDVVSEIKEISTLYDLDDVSITYSGEDVLFTEISEDLLKASIIAVVLIFIVMFFQFNGFIKPFIVLVTIPISFSGSFLGLLISNNPITATSLVGMVSLIGVTVNTGILLVEYISRRVDSLGLKEACVESLYLRFRPIMLTSGTTILGLIPLLITGGNFFRPMAITFMGGMVTSTLITIFLVPSLYYLIYYRKEKRSS